MFDVHNGRVSGDGGCCGRHDRERKSTSKILKRIVSDVIHRHFMIVLCVPCFDSR